MECDDWPFRGTEALAAGIVTPHRLRTDFESIHRNVYIRRWQALTPTTRAVAAWLWSGRTATVAGLSAAALYRTTWIDPWLPAELNRRGRDKTIGILLHSDTLRDDEVCVRAGIQLTTPARTAFDLGRRKGFTGAVIRVDALMRATGVKAADVEPMAEGHRGARGLVQLRRVLTVADAGAESPYETRTRLVLIAGGLPRPQTQIEVRDDYGLIFARIDMGWEEWKVGVEFDGAALDRSRAAQLGHRSTGRTRRPGLADHPRQRRLAPEPPRRRRRPGSRRAARCRMPDLTRRTSS